MAFVVCLFSSKIFSVRLRGSSVELFLVVLQSQMTEPLTILRAVPYCTSLPDAILLSYFWHNHGR